MTAFLRGPMGWVEVICGPMFSGKSEELIRRLRRAQIARQRVQVFKPVIDDRYSKEEIVSHSEQRIPARNVHAAREILEQMDPRRRSWGSTRPISTTTRFRRSSRAWRTWESG